ncbi:MAG: phosphatase PAP2 family protein [Terrimicrobiaceae bacterium]|nr:phosphatase PAP2 family protein [Terrimicrobiaceae bacterium]
MPSRGIVWILLLVAAVLAVWGAFQIDRPVREAIVTAQGKNWKKSAEARFHGTVRKIGDWPPLMAAALVALAIARAAKGRKWTRIIAAAMVASTLAGIIANSLRLTTGRTRPRESPKVEQAFHGPWHSEKRMWLIGNSGYNSFPSGHTATAFGFALVFLVAAPLTGLVVTAGAVLVAWSSLAIGAHHPSDIVVSILLSAVVAWFVWKWMNGPGGVRLDRILRMPSS